MHSCDQRSRWHWSAWLRAFGHPALATRFVPQLREAVAPTKINIDNGDNERVITITSWNKLHQGVSAVLGSIWNFGADDPNSPVSSE